MIKRFEKIPICCLMFMILASVSFTALAAEKTLAIAPPQITTEAAIVVDASTMQIYYEKNMHEKLYPASITKILTALVAVENSSADDLVTVPADVTKSQRSDYANIALKPGELVTQEALFNTMFIASANDSAQVIAENVGGTLDNFVKMMNYRARQAGCVDSSFSNSNGLPDVNNITSAYDMARITFEAIKNPTLMKYFSAHQYSLPSTNLRNDLQSFITLHKMMKNTVYYDKEVIAGKTGWESMSKNTLVTVAKRGTRTLISVQLRVDTSYTMYTEARKLLEYGFAQPEAISNGETVSYNPGSQTTVAAAAIISSPKATIQFNKNAIKPNYLFIIMLAVLSIFVVAVFYYIFLIIIKNDRKLKSQVDTSLKGFDEEQTERYKQSDAFDVET
jgi:D-alanyl-D-alanine carboxypeptidase